MNSEELKVLFDQQAAGYNKQWARTAPINNALYFLLESVFADLPSDARILCVGVGTGKELIHLANKFPGWSFTAVEPSGAMLDVCRHQTEEAGISSRCSFHEGYLDSLPAGEAYDGATCFWVSQFILDKEARSAFFQQIANRLKPGGILASSDLAAEIETEGFEALFRVWFKMMSASDATPEWINRMKAAYEKDVAILPPSAIASIIEAGGFETPVEFFKAGLIHAWFARCASDNSV